MQHIIELDQETEQNLNSYVLNSGETEKDILENAVKLTFCIPYYFKYII